MEIVDVVVIGAGFSGLAAARRLTGAGLTVAVLEALPVCGGRTRSAVVEGSSLELGGQWASAHQTELLSLASQVGVSTFPTPTEGMGLLIADGARSDLAANPVADELVAAVNRLDEMAGALSDVEPWPSAHARAYDDQTLDAWAAQQIDNPIARHQLVTVLEELMTAPAPELSVLTVLQSARSSGTLAAAMGIEEGAQELRFAGGIHQIAQRVADDLGPAVRTNWPVSHITLDNEGAAVSGPRGSVRASHVVVAIAPSMARHLTFDPPLPPARELLHHSMPMGSVIKVNVVYDRPFWRDEGLSGLVMDFDGPMTYGVDNSSPGETNGVLVSFFAGAHARRFSSLGTEARRESVLAQATRWFGANAAAPIAYVDHDWTIEPWIGGGYSGVMLPGAWQDCGPALRPSFGCVHWASSETATEWTGYVEGAIRAGYRAADEVLAASV